MDILKQLNSERISKPLQSDIVLVIIGGQRHNERSF